ncbi:MAG: hypothetical protein ACNI27_11195 [Desulfovibrio sp.]
MVWSKNLGLMGGRSVPDVTQLVSTTYNTGKLWLMDNLTKAFHFVDIPDNFFTTTTVLYPYEPYRTLDTPGLVGCNLWAATTPAALQIYNAQTNTVANGPLCTCVCTDADMKRIFYGSGSNIYEYDPASGSQLVATLTHEPQFIFRTPAGEFYYISKDGPDLYKHTNGTDTKITLQGTGHPLVGAGRQLCAFHYNPSLDAFTVSEYNGYVYMVNMKNSTITKVQELPYQIKWYGLALASDGRLAASWFYNGVNGGINSGLYICTLDNDLNVSTCTEIDSWTGANGSFGLTFFKE